MVDLGPQKNRAGSGANTRVQLSVGLTGNLRTRPILDGFVTADAIDMVTTELHPSELFWRQLKFAEFDVSEMSVSSWLMAVARGDDRFVGLPIFTTRFFFQTWALVRKDAGIDKPEDLKGKRVGVPEFQQTAALWSRGILQHEFGVEPKDMEFFMERTPDISHGGSTGFTPPPGVTVNQIPIEKNIGQMMLDKELDATLLYLPGGNLVDRSTADLDNHPDIRPLFPDPYAEGKRFYSNTGLYPINHGMVIKREVAEKHPWAILNIFKAFEDANAMCDQQRMAHTAYWLDAGLLPPEAKAALATPLVRHGVIANRKTLETIAQYSYEQGLTPRQLKLEEIFAENTLDK
ncbi:MAG: ABC transporter substrate-binding protein [Alphaproteobacteria bacterium]|jgi:4,5-dihydroxyphthalate decarboxylase